MRRSRSVYFELEEESEYTRGPIKVVSASDGVNDNCAALLLNMRFSDSIKTAIEMQRELNGEIREAQKQDEKTRISLEQIEERLERYHSRQVDLVRGATGVNSEGFAALETEFPKISKKIRELENLKTDESACQQHRQTRLQARYKAFHKTQRVVNSYLESAFVDARLLPPHPRRAADTQNPPGWFTLDGQNHGDHVGTEHATYREPTSSPGQRSKEPVAAAHRPVPKRLPNAEACSEHFDTVHGIASVQNGGSSLHCCVDTAVSQVSSPEKSNSMDAGPVIRSAEYVAALNLHKEYVLARNRYCDAKQTFHLRGEARDREDYFNSKLLQTSGGLQGMAQRLFDLSRMKRKSKLTRDLIDAEDGCLKAKAAAIEGGWQLDNRIHEANAKYAGDYHPVQKIYAEGAPLKGLDEGSASSGGYLSNWEGILQVNAPRERIEHWRQMVSEYQGIPESSATPPDRDSLEEDDSN